MFSYNFWFKNVEFLYLTLLITVWSLFWRESDIFIFKLSWFLFLFLYVINLDYSWLRYCFLGHRWIYLSARRPGVHYLAPCVKPVSWSVCQTDVTQQTLHHKGRGGGTISVFQGHTSLGGWPEKCKHDGVY